MAHIARSWLDNEGRFRFGKHQGGYAADVVEDDRQYVEWAVGEAKDMDQEDRDVLETLLKVGTRTTTRRERGRR